MSMHTQFQTPRIAPGLVWRQLDDHTVVVEPGAGQVRVLNRLGTVIWDLLVARQSPAQIEEYLVGRYAASREQVQTDLARFFADLESRNVIFWETRQTPSEGA